MRRVGDADKGKPANAVATVPVFVSRQDFPAGLTGSIFIAHDTLAMRRTVELELLEKAAYEVAVETSSPLALAICELESLVRTHVPGDPLQTTTRSAVSSDERRRVDKVLRLLGRVRHGYSKLAMFNPKARPQPSELSNLSLRAELEAIAAGLAETDRVRVTVEGDGALPSVRGDHFQIGMIFETLLSELLRYAPETTPVEAVLEARDGTVEVRLRGFMAPASDGEEAAREWSRTRADLAIAKPLIDEFMQAHHGTFEATAMPDRRTEFVLRFPGAGT
jgi:signal transduction histidine kinase